jgi:hypothetical protein
VTSDNATLPQEQIDAFLMQTEPAYALNVDGTDHSDAYRACYEQSGYTEPAFQSDPAQVLESKQELAESTNDWIACARENGYPQLADVTPSTILDVWPTAELPLTITPVALRNLLQDCPNFNEQLAWQQLSSEAYDDRWKPDPSISFALPGGPSGLSSHPDDPDTVRLRELTAILYEKQELFWRDQIDPSPTRHS